MHVWMGKITALSWLVKSIIHASNHIVHNYKAYHWLATTGLYIYTANLLEIRKIIQNIGFSTTLQWLHKNTTEIHNICNFCSVCSTFTFRKHQATHLYTFLNMSFKAIWPMLVILGQLVAIYSLKQSAELKRLAKLPYQFCKTTLSS